MKRAARHQRELGQLPEHLRGASWSDSRHLWFRLRRPDEFTLADVKTVAERGFFLDINPLGDCSVDLGAISDLLALFHGIRLSSEDPDSYVGIERICRMTDLRELWISASVDAGLDLSDLVSLERLRCSGEAGLSAFALPRLRDLGFSLPKVPPGATLTAPIRYLSFEADQLSNLDFISDSESLVSISVWTSRFDLSWLDRFERVSVVELNAVGSVLVPANSAVLSRPVDITFSDVSEVIGAEHLTSLPLESTISVQNNHAFPGSVQKLYARRDWYFAPYSAPTGSHDVSREPDVNGSDGVGFYPFIVTADEDGAEVYFDNWSLIDPLVESRDTGKAANEIIELAMVRVANDLGIEAEDDSEAESARLRVAGRGDAERIAGALRDLWSRDQDHAALIDLGLST